MNYLIFIYVFYGTNVYARSLKATADKLAEETSRIGLGIGLFGLTLAGIYLMLGRQDAGAKVTQALMGLFVLLLSPTIINFIKGLI